MSLTEDQQEVWDTGVALLKVGRLEEAQAAFDRLADLLPSSAPAWAQKASNLHHLGRYEDALAAIDHALALDASLGLGCCIKGDALTALLRYDDAVIAYGRALPLRADKAPPLIGLVRGLTFSKRYAEALPLIDHLELATQDTELVWHYRATAYIGLGWYEEALEAIGKAMQCEMGDREYDAWLVQGNAQYFLRHHPEALAAYEQAIRVRPSDHLGWEGKLRVLWRMRRWRAFWQTFKEAIAALLRR